VSDRPDGGTHPAVTMQRSLSWRAEHPGPGPRYEGRPAFDEHSGQAEVGRDPGARRHLVPCRRADDRRILRLRGGLADLVAPRRPGT
jgi:hypothetical protein